MGRRLLVVVFVAVAAACSSSGSTPNASKAAQSASSFVAPSTSATTSTTVAKHVASDAAALAHRLGCTKVDTLTDTDIGGLPKPLRSVGCTVGGVDLSIDVYASHADVERGLSGPGRAAVCSIAKGFGLKSPFYSVVGYDFTAQAETHDSNDSTLAQAQALGRALGLPVTTIRC